MKSCCTRSLAITLTLLALVTPLATPAHAQTSPGALTGRSRMRKAPCCLGPPSWPSISLRAHGPRRSPVRTALHAQRPARRRTDRVTTTMPLFKDATSEVTVEAGQERRLDFTLQLASVSEELTVRGGTALAREDKRAAASIIDVVSADAMGRLRMRTPPRPCAACQACRWKSTRARGGLSSSEAWTRPSNNVTLNGQIWARQRSSARAGSRWIRCQRSDLAARGHEGSDAGHGRQRHRCERQHQDSWRVRSARRVSLRHVSQRLQRPQWPRARQRQRDVWPSVRAGRTLGVVFGGSYSQRRYDSHLFRGSNGAWSQFNGFYVPQNQAFLLYDVNRRRQGYNGALSYRPRQGHEVTFASTATSSATSRGGSRLSST